MIAARTEGELEAGIAPRIGDARKKGGKVTSPISIFDSFTEKL